MCKYLTFRLLTVSTTRAAQNTPSHTTMSAPKFEITATAIDTSLPFTRPGFIGKVNGHNYSGGETVEDAIAKTAKMLADELEQVTAEALFSAMAADGDFARSAFSRALNS